MTHDIAFTRVCTEWLLLAFVILYLQTLWLQNIFNFMMPNRNVNPFHWLHCFTQKTLNVLLWCTLRDMLVTAGVHFKLIHPLWHPSWLQHPHTLKPSSCYCVFSTTCMCINHSGIALYSMISVHSIQVSTNLRKICLSLNYDKFLQGNYDILIWP